MEFQSTLQLLDVYFPRKH